MRRDTAFALAFLLVLPAGLRAQVAARWGPVVQAALPLVGGGPAGESALNLAELDLAGPYGTQVLAPVEEAIGKTGLTPELFERLGEGEKREKLTKILEDQTREARGQGDRLHSRYTRGEIGPEDAVSEFDAVERLLLFGHPFLSPAHKEKLGHIYPGLQEKAGLQREIACAKAVERAAGLKKGEEAAQVGSSGDALTNTREDAPAWNATRI